MNKELMKDSIGVFYVFSEFSSGIRYVSKFCRNPDGRTFFL